MTTEPEAPLAQWSFGHTNSQEHQHDTTTDGCCVCCSAELVFLAGAGVHRTPLHTFFCLPPLDCVINCSCHPRQQRRQRPRHYTLITPQTARPHSFQSVSVPLRGGHVFRLDVRDAGGDDDPLPVLPGHPWCFGGHGGRAGPRRGHV